MLLAQSKNRLIWAEQATHQMNLVCPGCKQKVIFRKGQHKIAHFAHVRHAECGFSEGETTEHLKGKKQLYHWTKQQGWSPQLETYLPQIAQRPDLLLTIHGQRVALEFQCSPLSLERMIERNQGYQKLGIRVCWLLGQPYQRRLGCKKVVQFTQLINHRPVILYWNTKRRQLIQRDFQCCSYSRQRFNKAVILGQQIKCLQKLPLRTPRPAERALLLAIYPRRLAQCPLVCHDIVPTWPISEYPLLLWRIEVILHLEKMPLFSAWQQDSWHQLLYVIGKSHWATPACVEQQQLLQPVFRQFTRELISNQIMLATGQQLVLIRRPQWVTNPDDKLKLVSQAKSA